GGGLAGCVAGVANNKGLGAGVSGVVRGEQGIRGRGLGICGGGGMESMSNAPYLLARVREGLRMGNTQLVDSMIGDGLWCSFEQWHMGNAGEVIASECGIGRAPQDEYALASHRKAADATAAGRFKAEILPVTIPQKRGDPIVFSEDESIRADSTLQALAALTPAFKKDGTVTAGNAPPVNDGAAALVVMSETRARELGVAPMARIIAQASSG